MKIKDIFREFYTLVGLDKQYGPNSIRDILIQDYIIMRIRQDGGGSLHYLTSGNYINFPSPWINLGIGLRQHSGDQILHYGPGQEDEVEAWIYQFIKFSQWWIGQWSRIDSEDFLGTLAKLSSMGTLKTRNYLEETYKLTLLPWELVNINKNIII